MWQAEYKITLKQGILDPAGSTIQKSLNRLGFTEVTEVRAGKIIRLIIAAENRDEARELADKMARELLVNPVTEDYELKLCEVN